MIKSDPNARRISLLLSGNTLAKVDGICRADGYSKRSEYVRAVVNEAVRKRMQEGDVDYD